MEGVVSVFRSKVLKQLTTRSWDFLGLTKSVKRVPLVESDIVIGIFDTGIWPESESFNDEGFGPPPKKWKGTCQTSGNVTCNNKLIGARYYIDKQFKDELTARDTIGHGTHCASIAAGREVSGVSLYGLARGNARGAVPTARIAMYRIYSKKGAYDDIEVLTAFDEAISDGVDIISISLGLLFPNKYPLDSISIGAFLAMTKGILTVQATGNCGPKAGTVASVAPWIFSVAASSIDREIVTKAIIGDGTVFQGKGINTFPTTKLVPLITCSTKDAWYCSPGSLKGKIVVCEDRIPRDEFLSAGAVGQIIGVARANDISDTYSPLPTTFIDKSDVGIIKSYMGKTKKARAKIYKSESIHDARAPVTASFSSRGPNVISPNILKPDISAPGVNILAAFSPVAPLTKAKQDKRSVRYHISSGTSMACPHVAGAAAYVKSFHPDWSPAAIKSALMTTASPMDARRIPEAEFAFGAGQVNPVKAVDPGLVYDAGEDDYIQFLRNEGYNLEEMFKVKYGGVTNDKGSTTDLNYPSMQVLVATDEHFSASFSRSVTNVGSPESTYKAIVKQHPRLQITIKPTVLSFKRLNEKQYFTVTVTGRGLEPLSMLSSSLVWSDGVHSVRSPIVVYTSGA